MHILHTQDCHKAKLIMEGVKKMTLDIRRQLQAEKVAIFSERFLSTPLYTILTSTDGLFIGNYKLKK